TTWLNGSRIAVSRCAWRPDKLLATSRMPQMRSAQYWTRSNRYVKEANRFGGIASCRLGNDALAAQHVCSSRFGCNLSIADHAADSGVEYEWSDVGDERPDGNQPVLGKGGKWWPGSDHRADPPPWLYPRPFDGTERV